MMDKKILDLEARVQECEASLRAENQYLAEQLQLNIS
jgi:hypothetical protein